MSKLYTVQDGDTLQAIARRFDVTPTAIFQASNFRSNNINILYPGETIVIPDNPDDPTKSLEITETPEDVLGEVNQDKVYVTVDGKTFGGWTDVEIQRAIDTAASGFSISAPYDPDRQELVDTFRPFAYNSCRVYIGNQLIITGTIELLNPSLGDDSRMLNIQGRSFPGALVDCSIDRDGWEFFGLTLGEIARKFCEPFGIAVSLIGPDTPKQYELRPELGQQYYSFLQQVADAYGRLITDDAQGRLVIQEFTPSSDPVASIVEGESLLAGASANYDGTQRFSKYMLMTQFAGVPDLNSSASDRGVTVHRPFVRVGELAEFEDIQQAAEWQRSRAFASSVDIQVQVRGWRHNNRYWNRGDTVTAYIPSIGIRRESLFTIAGVTFRISPSEGRVAQLRLVLPETYTRQFPEVFPWE